EIFGPVVSVIKFHDETDALRIANGTAYSLAAGVWSRDIGRVQRFAKKANAGTVWINTYGYTDVRLPWGGVRDSGFGREHGTAAIDNFTEPKAVWMNLNVCAIGPSRLDEFSLVRSGDSPSPRLRGEGL